jgi:hypothetical protein
MNPEMNPGFCYGNRTLEEKGDAQSVPLKKREQKGGPEPQLRASG